MIPADVVDFLLATQPTEWARLKQHYGADVKPRFLGRLSREIARRGALDVLRNGVRDSGCKFRLAYFRPASGLNEELQRLHGANLFAVARQLHFSETTEQSLDLALFLNGIPVFTAELKNPLTGQDVSDAIRQYREDRDPREPLFGYARCLAHFAVDPDQVYVTTQLRGPKTRFLPFNQGRYGGAGNPPIPPTQPGYSTDYLWERIWARDSILDLVRQFIHEVGEEDDRGRRTGKRFLIFPRYQQLDCVRRLVGHARNHGAGERYLVQHSAGSGKSFTIAWLAHQLSVLHDQDDRRIFDSIVVVTDRRVLDRQLQSTIRQFEQTLGVVENIDQTARQLREALEAGRTIIVTTLQKFPVISEQIGELPGKRFAAIVDEAHSSQSGESSKSLKAVLAAGSLQEAEAEEAGAETPEEEIEGRVLEEIRRRGRLPNLSTFAFTATPKSKTLELFGRKRPDGKFRAVPPLHDAPGDRGGIHPRRARELRDLQGVLAAPEEDRGRPALRQGQGRVPAQDLRGATSARHPGEDRHLRRALRRPGGGRDPWTRQGHDRDPLAAPRGAHQAGARSLSGGKGSSLEGARRVFRDGEGRRRVLHGVRHELPRAGPSHRRAANGSRIRQARVPLPGGREQVPDRVRPAAAPHHVRGQKARRRERGPDALPPEPDAPRQTGHDGARLRERSGRDPEGVRAVLRSHAPLGGRPTRTSSTKSRSGLLGFGVFGADDVAAVARVVFGGKATQQQLYAALGSPRQRFAELSSEEGRDFRGELTDYVRLYAFLSQVMPFSDQDLEELYVFARFLRRLLPADREQLPYEVQQSIDMESFRIQQTSRGRIALERQAAQLDPAGSKARGSAGTPELEPLSRIIEALNERFGLNLGDEHRLTLEQLRSALDQDAGLDASARVNTRENARLTFDPKVEDRIQEIVETNFDLYKRITDDPDFGRAIKDLLFDDYIQRHRRVEDLLKLQESKTLEFKSSLRWSLKEDRKDDKHVTHAVLKTIAAFLNTEGGDLLIGVADDGTVLGIEHDRLENDDKFMRHLAQVVRNGLGVSASTCIDPRTQVVEGKTVCLVSCQRSPEPVYLRWKGLQKLPEGDFYVRSGPSTVRLGVGAAEKYVATRFGSS